MVEKLGIVYTPVEVVDFIVNSVADVLEKEFGRSISDENIHILDPFTGTGTFITRLLQSGRIKPGDLERKYRNEIHANEIVLLAYYIAAINIENVYHDLTPDPDDGIGKEKYTPFDGICLTDTFQLGETVDGEKLFSEMFPQNSKRVQRQKKAPLRIIIGNPPYSVGQKSGNDNAQNQKYGKLDARIGSTYAALTIATNKNSLYNSYMKAFRWSTDRLNENNEHGGLIAFVTDAGWINNTSHDGFRKMIKADFSAIYVFNLRGDQNTSGEVSRKEGGKILGSGSRSPIAITLLVKNPATMAEKANIHYYDIGDYLDRDEKLRIIKRFGSFVNDVMPLMELQPNEHGDWIGARNDVFGTFIAIDPEKKFDVKSHSFFIVNSRGNETSRDAWIYASSTKSLTENVVRTFDFYNKEVDRYIKAAPLNGNEKITDFIDSNPSKISWTSSLIAQLEKRNRAIFEKDKIEVAVYRPYVKQLFYRGEKFIHRRGQFDEIFPTSKQKNLVICTSGIGGKKQNTALISNHIPDLNFLDAGTQCFPFYFYERNSVTQKGLFDAGTEQQYTRRDGISDFILGRAQKQYGKNVSKEDIFYYVYGFLHSPEYRETFAADLKKMLPRLSLVENVKDFWTFSKAGRVLAELHLNYESVAAHPDVKLVIQQQQIEYAEAIAAEEVVPYLNFRVEKMRFHAKTQKDSIIYNNQIFLVNIPAKAYEYVVNGKSAIEWIMERYQITTHKESGITNNPNDWANEQGKPRYILDLLLSIINVSCQTVDIVAGLPKVDFS